MKSLSALVDDAACVLVDFALMDSGGFIVGRDASDQTSTGQVVVVVLLEEGMVVAILVE